MAKNIKSHDVEVEVTGVSMEGESDTYEHNRTTEENQKESQRKETSNSRKDG